MVSLFDICLEKPKWSHISTGVASIDAMIDLTGSGAIIDFQSTPIHNAMFATVCNMIVTQLEYSEDSHVIVLETFNPFPWGLYAKHPRYNKNWDARIKKFQVSTFAQILAFFICNPMKALSRSSLVIIVNFHEVMEFYRHQLNATFEEALLKLEIEKNEDLLNTLKRDGRIDTPGNGQNQDIPLFKESPLVKYQEHVDEMFKHLNGFLREYSLIILLLGCMDVKSRVQFRNPESANDSQTANNSSKLIRDSSTRTRSGSRYLFTPVTYDKRVNSFTTALNDSKILQRILFFKDFYRNSHHYSQGTQAFDTDGERIVAVAKPDKENASGNIMEPSFFDFAEKFYQDTTGENCWLIDLQESNDGDLSNYLEESILLTQQLLRPSSERSSKRPKVPNIPSSPVKQVSNYWSDENGTLAISLVIEGSDVELTGTIFEE